MSNINGVQFFLDQIEKKGLNNYVKIELRYLAVNNCLTWEWFKLAVLISESEVFKLVYKEIGLTDSWDMVTLNKHFVNELEKIIHYEIGAL